MVNCNAIGCVLEPMGTKRWTYHTMHSREVVLENGYFNGFRTTLRPGDLIDIPFVNGTIMGWGLYMVDRADNTPDENHVAVTLWEIMHFDRNVAPPKTRPLTDEMPPPPEYVPEDCEIKWNPGLKGHQVIGKSGTVYSYYRDKTLAQAVARGDKPIVSVE